MLVFYSILTTSTWGAYPQVSIWMVTTLGIPFEWRIAGAPESEEHLQDSEGQEEGDGDEHEDSFEEEILEDPPEDAVGVQPAVHLNSPECVCVDPHDGSIYVTDTIHCSVRKVSPAGRITNMAGDGKRGQRDGRAQAADFLGADKAPEAQFRHPRGISIDDVGNLFVCDTENHTVRGISREGRVSTLAGSGRAGFQDGPALQVLHGSHALRSCAARGTCYYSASACFYADYLSPFCERCRVQPSASHGHAAGGCCMAMRRYS